MTASAGRVALRAAQWGEVERQRWAAEEAHRTRRPGQTLQSRVRELMAAE